MPLPSPNRSAGRTEAAWGALAALALASCGLAILALLEHWRVTPRTGARITVLGHMFSYPTANAAAVVVLCEALLGLLGVVSLSAAAARELIASRRLDRRLRSRVTSLIGDAGVIDDPQPRAFCAGLLRPRVYVSSGAVAALDGPALDAVLLHEREHARRRDPLWQAAARALDRGLWFIPGLRALAESRQLLAELRADEAAVELGSGGRPALARAMLAFDQAGGAGAAVGIDAMRADALVGTGAEWRFPVLVCLVGVAAITLVVLVAILAGRVAAGSATLSLPFLSSQPCVVVLALVPSAVALLALRGLWRRR